MYFRLVLTTLQYFKKSIFYYISKLFGRYPKIRSCSIITEFQGYFERTFFGNLHKKYIPNYLCINICIAVCTT